MNDKQTYSVVLNDLYDLSDCPFRVYFLWGKHYYIELLRPLERKDFLIVSPLSNAIDFIVKGKEDDWTYTRECKHKSDGKEYDLVYKAKYTLQLRYKDELIECISKGLNRGTGNVTDLLGLLFSLYKCGLHIKYNYRGCVSRDSKENKDDRILEELKSVVSSSPIDKLYLRAIDELTSKVTYCGESFKDIMMRSLSDNPEYHQVNMLNLSGNCMSMIEDIKNKRIEIGILEEDIERLSSSVEKEYKIKLRKDINDWDDMPSVVVEYLEEVVDELSLVGVVRGFPNSNNILIK